MAAKSLQDNTKMLLMPFFIVGVDQDVVNEDHDKLVQPDMNTEFIRYMKCAGGYILPLPV
jgi:hypothetical protein